MISIPLEPLYVGMMVFFRLTLILAFFPIFGESYTPLRVRVLLAVAMSWAIAGVVPVQAAVFPESLPQLLLFLGSETLIGFTMATIVRMTLSIIQMSAQVAGEQMGFGLVNALDPANFSEISVIANMLYMGAILLFFATGVHLDAFAIFLRSFEVIPPGGAGIDLEFSRFIIKLAVFMFDAALQLAMPVIIIVFTITITLGMIAKAVPQINLFIESFPLRIIAGVAITLVTLGLVVQIWQNIYEQMVGWLETALRLMA